MLQSRQRLLQLNAKLAENLLTKGVEVDSDETTTSLIDKVANITVGGDNTVLKGMIQRDVSELTIPDDITCIGDYAFSNCTRLESITIPENIISINKSAFYNCSKLNSVIIKNLQKIGNSAFASCSSLKEFTLPSSLIAKWGGGDGCNHFSGSGIETLNILCKSLPYKCLTGMNNLKELTIPKNVTSVEGFVCMSCRNLENVKIYSEHIYNAYSCFNGCTKLKYVYICNQVQKMRSDVFAGCAAIEFVDLEDEFNTDGLYLSPSTLYSRETILQWLNALADRTGQTAYKLTIGATNLAKLTEEDILNATNKNWTLA